jgi:Subtilase family
MPEHQPLIDQRAAFEKLLRDPIKDAAGRIKHIVLLDPAEIEKVKDKGSSKKRINKISKDWHKAKTKETIAQIEDELGIEVETVLSSLVEGMVVYLDVAKKAVVSKDIRVKSIGEDRYLSYSGAVWEDSNNSFTQEITPWGVKAMGGPYAIGYAPAIGRLDDSPVYVLDSGVHKHIDLNVVAQEAVGGNAVAGCYAHATMVAGVIGAMDGATRINVAAASEGGVASASTVLAPGFDPKFAINGERRGAPWGNGGGWSDATTAPAPDWLQVNFSTARSIDRVVVYSVQDNYTSPVEPTPIMTFSSFGLRDFRVEYWTGAAWAPIPGAEVAGNNLIMRGFDFAAITTSAIRVYVEVASDGYSRMTEIEAFANVAGTRVNVALSSNGAVASASSTYGPGYSPAYAINGERRGANWGGGGGWNDGTIAPMPDWLQVNFSESKTIDRLVVISVQDDYINPLEPTPTMTFTNFGLRNFRVEYWTGAAWLAIPGASVSANNLVLRTFNFAAITTTAIRVVIMGAADGSSRLAEIEAFTVPVSAGVVGVRPGTPIHSVASQDGETNNCSPVAFTSDVIGSMELARIRVTSRCLLLGDCRPGISNLSINASETSSSTPSFANALTMFTQQNASANYPGSLLIHSAGNRQQPAQGVVVAPSSAADGYLRVGAIDQNGQQVRGINGLKGFANNPLDDFNGVVISELDGTSDKGSNHGPDVDLWAPGRGVRSTSKGNNKGYGGGTSFSAPHIAGLAAKLRESIANWSTPGQLEQLVRTKSISNQARDDSGLIVSVAQIGPNLWRAKPTVELFANYEEAKSPLADHPSKAAIQFSVRERQIFGVNMDSLGGANCTYTSTWNGVPWHPATPVPARNNYFGGLHLDVVGTFRWTFRCVDPFDSSIDNTAVATIQVTPAPPEMTGKWLVNGIERTWLSPAGPSMPAGLNSPYIVSRSQGSSLGFFTLRFIAINAVSCTMTARTNGYVGYDYLINIGSIFPISWYGPVAIANTGNNWDTVGLFQDRYTWSADCIDAVGTKKTYNTHVEVQ